MASNTVKISFTKDNTITSVEGELPIALQIGNETITVTRPSDINNSDREENENGNENETKSIESEILDPQPIEPQSIEPFEITPPRVIRRIKQEEEEATTNPTIKRPRQEDEILDAPATKRARQDESTSEPTYYHGNTEISNLWNSELDRIRYLESIALEIEELQNRSRMKTRN